MPKAKKKTTSKKTTKKKETKKKTSKKKETKQSKSRAKSSELQQEILSFMRKKKEYTSRQVVEGLNRKPGGKEGGPVVNALKSLEKQGLVKYGPSTNSEYRGYAWIKK